MEAELALEQAPRHEQEVCLQFAGAAANRLPRAIASKFGTGSTSRIIISLFSKPCFIDALYMALENLDAIALTDFPIPLDNPRCRVLFLYLQSRCETASNHLY